MNCQLTTRQQQVFDFISAEILQRQRAPTRVEIARHFGFRPNAAEDHVRALASRGVVEIAPKTHRGIRLTGHVPHPPKCSRCSLLGQLLLECRAALPNTDLADRINDELDLWDVPGEAPAHRYTPGPTGGHGTKVAVRSVTGAAGSAVATVTTASLEGSDVNPSSVTVVTS